MRIFIFLSLFASSISAHAIDCPKLLMPVSDEWAIDIHANGWKKIEVGESFKNSLDGVLRDSAVPLIALKWVNFFGLQRTTIGKVLPTTGELNGLYLIEKMNGEISLVDPTAIQIREFYSKDAPFTAEETSQTNWQKGNREPPLRDKNFKKYCAFIKNLKNSKEAPALAQKIVRKTNALPAVLALTSCIGEVILYESAVPKYEEARRGRKHGRSWLSEHGSNAVYGLVYMNQSLPDLLFDQGVYPNEKVNIWENCLPIAAGTAAMGGKFYLNWVRAVAAANLAGNVWEEIKIPGLASQKSGEQFTSGGQEVRTDWADFSSGAGTSLAFWLYHESVYRLGTNLFSRICQ